MFLRLPVVPRVRIAVRTLISTQSVPMSVCLEINGVHRSTLATVKVAMYDIDLSFLYSNGPVPSDLAAIDHKILLLIIKVSKRFVHDEECVIIDDVMEGFFVRASVRPERRIMIWVRESRTIDEDDVTV